MVTKTYTEVLEDVINEMSVKNPEIAITHIEERLSNIAQEAVLLRKILRKIRMPVKSESVEEVVISVDN